MTTILFETATRAACDQPKQGSDCSLCLHCSHVPRSPKVAESDIQYAPVLIACGCVVLIVATLFLWAVVGNG